MKTIVSVESPALNGPRRGRGFSKDELAEIKMSIKEARDAGIIVDIRRKSKYDENVTALKAYQENYAKVLAEKEKTKIKAQKDNIKARKEAEKRKKLESIEGSKREKEIEAEKLKIQEEIAKREAEELAAETAAEELSEEEQAELDELEEGLAPAEGEEATEEAELEQLEEDLAESLGDEPASIVTTASDGTKRVVKRVRKTTTTTKGVTDKAEKKE